MSAVGTRISIRPHRYPRANQCEGHEPLGVRRARGCVLGCPSFRTKRTHLGRKKSTSRESMFHAVNKFGRPGVPRLIGLGRARHAQWGGARADLAVWQPQTQSSVCRLHISSVVQERHEGPPRPPSGCGSQTCPVTSAQQELSLHSRFGDLSRRSKRRTRSGTETHSNELRVLAEKHLPLTRYYRHDDYRGKGPVLSDTSAASANRCNLIDPTIPPR